LGNLLKDAIDGILPSMDTKRLSRLGLVLLLLLLAFSLRLHRLSFQPLWGDEGWSFYFASMSLGDMVRLTAVDIHPPLYYALLGGWLQVAGSTPEAARFLSVVVGTLLAALAYRTAARLFDRTAGLATAAVVTLAPFAVYYSQEARMYGLVTLLSLASVYFFSRRTADGQWQTKHFWGYVLTTAAALYTMYYAAFVPLFEALYVLLVAGWRRRARAPRPYSLRRFFYAIATIALLYLPWVAYAGTKLVAYVQSKRAVEGYTPLDLASFVTAHLAAFSLGHFSKVPHSLAWAAVLFMPVVLLGLVYRKSSPSGRAHGSLYRGALLALYLLVPLLCGYLVNQVYPFTPRYFERTLMLAAPAWWLLLGAGLAWLWRWNRSALAGAGAVLLLTQTVMLFDFYDVPRYPDADLRDQLAYVRAHSTPGDVFLASYQWQVGFYYAYLTPPRPQLYAVPGWGEAWAADPTRLQADLDGLIRSHPRLWFPAYQLLGHTWESQVESYLNQTAFPARVDWSVVSAKLTLYGGGSGLVPAASQLNFGGKLAVEQAEVGGAPVEAGRGVVPVALTWRKLGNLGSDQRVALRLADDNGQTWASRDSLPQGGEASFASMEVGQQLIDRHGLAIPAGVPPGSYQLRLSVQDQVNSRPLDLLDAEGQPRGVEATLATVRVVPPVSPLLAEALPVQHRLSADFDRRARLLGYSLGNGPFRAGDELKFSLFWQALADGDGPIVVFAQLQDAASKPVALSETPPIYPGDLWKTGDLLRDPRSIPLPADLPAGTYRLAVGLLRPDRSRLPVGGGDQVILTTVGTTQRPHDFSPPSPQHPLDIHFGDHARLVGYDVRETAARPGDTVALTLYWQALGTFDRAYAVFAHLITADNRIAGQRDQAPGDGAYPTTSWVAGEYIADTYAIPVDADTPPGEYWIEVGIYDPLNGSRLPVAGADGQALGDRLLLKETRIRVVK
jgi:4-amino-4-deoxy-L-arabinose transferase-like glycosyltransferase